MQRIITVFVLPFSFFSSFAQIGNVINTYTQVVAFDHCENKLTVEDASTFNTGDTVLMIQMKGAIIDSSNTSNFGTVTDYQNAGNYEFNFVKSKTGNIIELKNTLTKQYNIPIGKVQLVRVPYYKSVTVTSTLTCLPWDGSKGGILILNAADAVILNAPIDVSGKGFRGGKDPYSNPSQFYCYENQYYYPPNPDLASEKGEGIAIISPDRSFGKGALANGGGSGSSHNSGGGGGSNASQGGFGGYNYEFIPCNTIVPFDNRGVGGKTLSYNNILNKIFPGGGGGAGHSNNPQAFESKGGNGSGIIIIIADNLKSNNLKIIANGINGAACGSTGSGCHEGMGGGGAGGTVLLSVNSYIDNLTIEGKGGNGANMTSSGNYRVGPGGGGSAGVTWFNNNGLPANVSTVLTGGLNGVCTAYANDPWGATSGQNGTAFFNLKIPADTLPFNACGLADSCSMWLETPSTPSYVTVGDIDITGNKLTVEAKFNRSSAFDNSIALGKLVSKHTGSTNVNYSLLPLQCEITTDITGYVATPPVCFPTQDKTYHAAMVYDGATLKFYRNGFLLTQTPCTGNLVNNNLLTTIGQIAGNGYPDETQFKGYINEVRIWNVARTQTELRANMGTSLTSPPTQPGLVAYYVFDDLTNKQGNVAYNGTLTGSATINATNPNCTFVADSCGFTLPVTLTDFETNIVGKQIKLNWDIESEDGVRSFTVERSLTGHSDFVSIGTVVAGNIHSYSFVDNTAGINENYYYRLAILENDGAISYSEIKKAKINAGNKLTLVYPNPSKGTIVIRINGYKGSAKITVINSVGQVIQQKSELIIDNSPVILKLNRQSKGIYWLKIETNNEKSIEKIMIF